MLFWNRKEYFGAVGGGRLRRTCFELDFGVLGRRMGAKSEKVELIMNRSAGEARALKTF